MTTTTRNRFLSATPPEHVQRPLARVQPVLAAKGKPTIDIDELKRVVEGTASVAPLIRVESPAHWERAVRGLGPEVDAILPISIPAYPTEVWNSHPRPLVDRGLPVLFWPLMAYDEPDFWRWSARDFLSSLGVDVVIAKNTADGLDLLRSLAMKRFLRESRMIVFGEQNFPWNANEAGLHFTRSMGTRILVKPLSAFRERAAAASEEEMDALWRQRGGRYRVDTARPNELRQALRTTIGIRSVLQEEKALGFGVNCYGELIIEGGRDVPCLAQSLLREEGYIASCDGDFCAMMSMALASCYLEAPCMMSNMYPVSYVGALTDHFGDPLTPSGRYPRESRKNLARLAHCGFVGIVPPEMSPAGTVRLTDFGGTYEIARDGRGCGIDGDLRAGERITVVELKFDGKTLLVAGGWVRETTRHGGMPHCESSVLLEFDDLQGFLKDISREHTVVLYGDHGGALQTLARVLDLDCRTF